MGNEERYDGSWVYGVRMGEGTGVVRVGTWYCSDGSRYEGEWKDNKRNGYGVEWHPDGEKYCGNWVNNVKCGRGPRCNKT